MAVTTGTGPSWRAGTAVVIAVIMLGSAALWATASNRLGTDNPFRTPAAPQGDAVAVLLAPYDVVAGQQLVSAELGIFVGPDMEDEEGRLERTISVDTFGPVSRTVTFERGSVPSPVKIDVPAPGVVQQYPFDQYRFSLEARAVDDTRSTTAEVPLPMSMTVYFNIPGWDFTQEVGSDQSTSTAQHSLAGTITRDDATRTIAMIFIGLIFSFGVLSVVAVGAAARGRVPISMSMAAWLTGAIFALVTLRNNLPGSPPLGSVMDIAVYFWVIAAIMLMIGATVILLVTRGSDNGENGQG
jgi:Domain of unknown function (DUF4436)